MLFNLDTGAEISRPENLIAPAKTIGIAVSPSGSTIAVVRKGIVEFENRKPASEDRYTLAVIDLRTHSLSQVFYLPDSLPVSGGSSSDTVDYAGEAGIALEEVSSGRDAGSSGRFVSIHILDIASGSQVRVFDDPEAADFRFLGMSADGHVMATLSFGKDARFALMNPETGERIAQSSPLELSHYGCSLLGKLNNCKSYDVAPDLALDQSGNGLIAFWYNLNEKQSLSVYTLQPH
jgi:hypothetical protein